jgi:DNA polymerase III epsilon subunit-like protein
MNFVAIDFETTGYLPGCENVPWQLGAVIVEDGKIAEMKEWFFTSPLTPSAESLLAQWEDIYPVISSRALVAHNIATERTILRRIAPLHKWGPWYDTLKIAKQMYPKLSSYKLSDLCALFGCEPEMEGRTWHDGLYDAVACANLAIRLIGEE